MNVSIGIGGRFHAFDLAAQMQRRGLLRTLITSYPKSKVRDWGVDSGRINSVVSHEFLSRGWRLLADRFRLTGQPQFTFNDRFDRIAAKRIPCDTDIFVAWSSMALHSFERAKQLGSWTVLERNSTHIGFQRDILAEEYARAGRTAQLPDPRIVDRELREYEKADFICVPSSFARRAFLERGVPSAKVFTVPFGVDSSVFRPVTEKRDRTFRIIHCGGLSIRKGVHYLLQAFHELNFPDAELWLIGPRPAEISPYLDKYRSPNIQVRGTFAQSALPEQYSQGSVFCLASVEEGFGMVISQAMACGLPVVCTTNTTGHDVVRNGEDGFVIPIRDVEALKDRLAFLHADRDRCRSMGESAREQVLGGFTWDHYGDSIARQYSRINQGIAPLPYETRGVAV